MGDPHSGATGLTKVLVFEKIKKKTDATFL